MEKDSRSEGQKKQRIHVNLGEAGRAIGVGVIFVGGVLATAALVANVLHRRLPKPTNKKNTNNNLISDGQEKPTEEGDNGDIPAQNFLPNGEHKFEVNDGKEEVKRDDEEISSCIQDSENRSLERDGYVVDKETISSSVVTDSLLNQPAFSSMKDISCVTVEIPKQDDPINKADSDQGKDEGDQLNQVQTEEQENNCCTYGQETGEVNIIMLSSNREHAALIDHDLETERNTDTTSLGISIRDLGDSSLNDEETLNIGHEVDSLDFKMVEAEKIDEISDAATTEMSRISAATVILEENSEHSQEDDLLALESIEVAINEIIELAHEHDEKSQTAMFTSENKEKICSHTNESFTVETRNGHEHEADQGDEFSTSDAIQTCEKEVIYSRIEVALTTAAAEALKAPELLEAPKAENQPDTPGLEEIEAQQHSKIEAAREMIEERENQDGDKTNAAEEAIEEREAQNDAQTDAAEEAAEEKEVEFDAQTYVSEEAAEEKEAQHDGPTDGAGAAVEEKEAQFDARTDVSEEAAEEKEAQHDGPTDGAGAAVEEKEAHDAQTNASEEATEEKEAQYDAQTVAAGEAVDEKEAQHDAQTDASEEAAEPGAQTDSIGEAVEGKEARHTAQTDEAGEAAKYDSGSTQANKLAESPGILDQAYNHSSHGMIFPNILPQENEQSASLSALTSDPQLKHIAGLKNDLKEAALDHDSSNLKIENFVTEPAIEEADDNSTFMQSTVETQLINQETEELLQELQDIYPTSDSTETTIEEHIVAEINEEDGVHKEEENTGSQPIIDKVEESSEGSVESSTESMSEPVWPADVIQETQMQTTEEEVIKNQKQKLEENGEDLTLQTMGKVTYSEKIKDGDNSSKSLQFINDDNGSSKMNLLKKHMLELVLQGDGENSFFLRQRAPALAGALLTLLWPLCSWYFGLPFLKVCLIAILVIVLSKIQGF